MPRRNLENEEKLRKFKEDAENLQWHISEINLFVPIAVCGTTPIGVITFINKTFQKLIGRKEIDIIGEVIENIFSDKEKIQEIIKEVAREKTIESRESTLISKKGIKIPVKVDVAARKDEEGNLIGYFIGITDITESHKLREELEKKVQKKTRELQEKIGELQKLAGVIINRELEMIRLKEEIKRLKEEINKARQVSDKVMK